MTSGFAGGNKKSGQRVFNFILRDETFLRVNVFVVAEAPQELGIPRKISWANRTGGTKQIAGDSPCR
jgi:hypothetical protein